MGNTAAMLAMWPQLMPLANQMNPHQQQQALYDSQCIQNQLMLGKCLFQTSAKVWSTKHSKAN